MTAGASHLGRRAWYWALVGTFGVHGLYIAAWISRTPETQGLLGLDTGSYGLFAMIMGLGSLLAAIIGARVIGRFGSRRVLLVSFIALGLVIAGNGLAIAAGIIPLSFMLTFLMGATSSFGGFANNVEGTAVDRASHRSLLPSLHGSFSAGMLVGSAIGAGLIAAGFPLWATFACAGAVIMLGGVATTRFIPRDGGLHITPDMNTATIATLVGRQERRGVWREPRTLVVAGIGFSFVLAEATAGTWLPVIVVTAGMTLQDGAVAFTFFAIAMTAGRLGGGFIVQRLSRPLLAAVLALLTVIGIGLVMATDAIHLPYLGAVAWGLGASLGFPLMSAALAEDQRLSTPRLRVLLVFSNVAGLTSGPLLGAVGQLTNLFIALGIPVAFLIAAASSARVSRPLPGLVKMTEAQPTTEPLGVVVGNLDA